MTDRERERMEAEIERIKALSVEALAPLEAALWYSVPSSAHDRAVVIVQTTAGALRRAAALRRELAGMEREDG